MDATDEGRRMLSKRMMEAFARQKKTVLRKLGRMIERTAKVAGLQVPVTLIKDVEDQINAEGWPQKIMRARFKSESRHGPGSIRWKALSPKYKQWRIRHGFGAGPILKRTGEMKAAAIESVKGTFVLRHPVQWDADNVGVEYAGYANAARPFMEPPTKRELQPAMERAKQLIRKEMRRLARVG